MYLKHVGVVCQTSTFFLSERKVVITENFKLIMASAHLPTDLIDIQVKVEELSRTTEIIASKLKTLADEVRHKLSSQVQK